MIGNRVFIVQFLILFNTFVVLPAMTMKWNYKYNGDLDEDKTLLRFAQNQYRPGGSTGDFREPMLLYDRIPVKKMIRDLRRYRFRRDMSDYNDDIEESDLYQ
ncbi:hypothetical protein GJ496_005125 [Pomphorhynchus laevis]|nr:hypothetical protein GJ496_005125 [Pomphorhynchus laevis]